MSNLTSPPLSQLFDEVMRELSPTDSDYVPRLLSQILQTARRHRASDIHLTPDADAVVMKWRIDGVLLRVAAFDQELGNRLVARSKVLAGLLTYRTDHPQEGRISESPDADGEPSAETRVATFPTLYGERSAIRLFADTTRLQRLEDLGLPAKTEAGLRETLHQTAGVVLLTGPSGSGKTTTSYACLREILAVSGESRGLMSLEDPIEQAVDGVTQSQVRPNAEFDLAAGLRAMLRQDPDVIMVGEIRDAATAEQVFRAALTGHLVLTTFHAGSSAEAVARLIELGIDPWLLRSTLRLIICQRLVRQSCHCEESAAESNGSEDSADKNLGDAGQSSCDRCAGTGYRGRFVLSEDLMPDTAPFASAVLQRADTRALQSIAKDQGMITLTDRATEAIAAGRTTPQEIYRVLGKTHG